jgi:hypothetical protein
LASSGNYRLNLVWVSHGEQLRADLNALQSKLSGVTQEAGRGQRQMGLWGQPDEGNWNYDPICLRRFYRLRVATAVTSLGEFESKLGEIDSLAATMKDGNLVGLGDRLNWLGDQAISMSNKYGLAVGSIQDQLRAFYSSGFTRTTPGMAAGWADILAQIQLITEGADPAKMAVGVAGLTQATGGGANPVSSAKRIRDIIGVVLRGSTAFRGEDIARDIGKLSGAGPALNMTPEQIFAVYGTAGKVGGSGAVIGRGITQLLTASLANPKTKSQKAAFAALGLPSDPGQLRQIGGFNVLMTLLRGIGPISGPARSALGNEGLTDEEALATPGLPQGKIGLLYKAIGRMESVRQVLSLASVGGADEIQKFLDSIRDGEKTERGLQQSRIVNEHRWYQQMAESQKNARMTIMRGFEFALKPAAHAVKRVSDEINRHQKATTIALGGAAAAGLFLKFFAGSSIAGTVMNRIPGLRRFAGAGERAGALGTAMAIGSGAEAFISQGTGRRSDPLWVVIDPLSWFFPGAPSGMGVNDKKPTGPGIPKPPVVPVWARRVGGFAGPVAAAAFAGFEVQDWLRHLGRGNNPLVEDVLRHANVSPTSTWGRRNPAVRNLFAQYVKGSFTKSEFENRLERMALHGVNIPGNADDALRRADRRARYTGPAGVGISGEADVTIRLEPADELRKTVKGQTLGVKVPIGTGNIPQHRGKNEVQLGAAAGASVR